MGLERYDDYSEIERLLAQVQLPLAVLVEQDLRTPPAIADVPRAVREALRTVTLPTGRVAVGIGSRGVGCIDAISAAVVAALREAGAEPFIVPAMGSHGGATAEGQAHVLAELGVTPERVGCPVRATMETVFVGVTPGGVHAYMDAHAYAADAVVVINRVKAHTAFRGRIESGPTKMVAIGLGKQRGAHAIHSAGWEHFHVNVPEVARLILATGKVAFGLAVLENAEEQPYRLAALPAERMLEQEPPLLAEAKQHLPTLPFDQIDVLAIDRIGKNISGDGADPNVTGRYPTATASGGPRVTRMAFFDLTDETDGNALGMGLADVITRRLAERVRPAATYANALTSTTPVGVRMPMVMPTPRLALAASLMMCAGVAPAAARIVRIQDTLHLGRFWASEACLTEIESDERLSVVEGPVEFPVPDFVTADVAVAAQGRPPIR